MRETLRRYIRTQMTMKNIKYRELSDRLAAIGVAQGERTLRNKVNKGNFGAQLFTFILIALDVEKVDMIELQKLYHAVKNDES